MPIREYECIKCRIRVECVEYGHIGCHICIDCGRPMEPVEFSVPARTRVGKYGKAGGLPPERE